MTCTDFEILLADYVDGILHGESKSAFEAHLRECKACAELAKDAQGAVAFMQRAAVVEAPPELVTRILFEITNGSSRAVVKPSWIRRILGQRMGTILQPRFAMGMAMTVLSFAMLGRFSGDWARQLKPSDLDPVKIWAATEDRVNRTWNRGVKFVESLKLVYEIQSRLKELTSEEPAGAPPGRGQPDPVQTAPPQQEVPRK
jgi:anti-sigma factor RsiW